MTTEDQLTKNKQNVVSLTFTKDGTMFVDANNKSTGIRQSIGIYYDGSICKCSFLNRTGSHYKNGQARDQWHYDL